MGYIISDNKRKKRDEYSIIYTLLIISAALRFQTFFQSVTPNYINFSVSLLSYGLAGFAMLLFIIKTMGNVKENRGFYVWILLALYMLLVAAMRTELFSTRRTSNSFYFVFQDIAYLVLFATGCVFANKKGVNYYHRLMLVLGFVSIFCGVFSFLEYDFDITRIYVRGDSLWTMSYFLWWPTISFSTYLFCYSRITKKFRLISYPLFIIAMVLALLFQKRGPLLEGVFIYFVLAFLKPVKYKKKSTKIFARVMTIIVTILIALMLFGIFGQLPYLSKVTDSLMTRFEEIDENGDSRVVESEIYYSEAPLDSVIFGQGAGCYFTTSRRFLNAIHIGYSNAVYKGGILYALFDLWIIICALKMLFKYKKLSPFGLTCMITTMAYLVTSIHDGGWSYTMTIFGYATPICYVLQYSEESDKTLKIDDDRLFSRLLHRKGPDEK